MSGPEYVTAKKFLTSLAYEARFAPSIEGLAALNAAGYGQGNGLVLDLGTALAPPSSGPDGRSPALSCQS